MSYSNYKSYNDPIKPYVHDSLEMLRLLEYKQYQDIHKAYIKITKRITDYISLQKGNFKGIDAELKKLIEEATKELNKTLQFIIYETLQQGASIALSINARLKVDEAFFNADYAKGEMNVIGEASQPTTKDKNVIVKKIQLDVSKKSEEIARHTMEKKRLYREKEFKISSRVWDLSNGQGDKIKKLVEAGINMDCKKLAKALDECGKLGNSKPIKEYPNMMKRLNGRFPPDTSFAAMRFSRNELSELYFTTSILDYMENPYIEAVQWLLANNRLKMYEDKCDCNDIAYEDVYGLGRGIYPLDKVPDRPHVMCLCNIAPITSRKLKKQLEGKMKLGNVPPEDWFKKQNHENNIELIKSKYIETGLKLFHNEKGRALGLASIDIIKEHKWFTNGVRAEDKRAFLDDLHKVNGRALYILARYTQNMQVDFYSETKTSYSSCENKIYCNLIKDGLRVDNKKMEFELGMKSFLHETGHWLDCNINNKKWGVTEKLPFLLSNLSFDTLTNINKLGKEIDKNFIPLKELTTEELTKIPKNIKEHILKSVAKEHGINSAVSDILGGLTQNYIKDNGFIHRDTYWNYNNKSLYLNLLRFETFANMFEAYAVGNDRLKIVNDFFPLSFRYFADVLGDLL
ncbi:MAG: hypothetical protein ACTTJ6_01960 [Treponema sp.]